MIEKIFYNVFILGTIISICVFPILIFLSKNKYKYNIKKIYKIFLIILLVLFVPFNAFNFSKIKSKLSDFNQQNIEPIVWNENNETIHFQSDNMIIEINENSNINIKNDMFYKVSSALPYVWIGISITLLLYNIFNYFVFVYKLKSKYVINERLDYTISQISKEINLNKKVFCKTTKQISSPMTIGILKRKIIIPIEAFEGDNYEAILRHELFHIKNKDIEYKFLLLFLNCIYWFNPIIYNFTNQVNEVLELNCDENVLQGKGEDYRIKYARTLLHQIEKNRNKQYSFSLSFASRRENIMNRFSNIVNTSKKKNSVTLATVLTVLIVLALIAIICIPNINFATIKENDQNKPEATENTNVEENTATKEEISTTNLSNPLQDEYVLTSRFGVRSTGEHHSGVDLATQPGTNIYACDGGNVVFAGWSGGYGYLVVVKHSDSIITCYSQCREILVKEGDIVNKGDVIAEVGSTGNSTGPHLHFEIRVDGEVVNPENYISF